MMPKDWTLLVIASAAGRPLTPVQLQKSLFLISRNLSPEHLRVESFYIFKPYDYGPFNQQIYNDAQQLRDEGYIIIDPDDGVRYRDYAATLPGLERSSELQRQLDGPTSEYLDAVVNWVRSLSFKALVQAIYKHYPDMKVNSVFR